jgi:alpha-galactosidase
MFGGHLPDTDPETLALLTNDAVLELLASDASREIVRDGDLVVWAAERGSTRWRAVFQLGDAPRTVTAHLADLGCPDATRATDLWTGEELAVVDGGIPLEVEAHGVRLLRLA